MDPITPIMVRRRPNLGRLRFGLGMLIFAVAACALAIVVLQKCRQWWAIQNLIQSLNEDCDGVEAAITHVQQSRAEKTAVDTLVRAMKDKARYRNVRAVAAHGLGKLGVDAETVVPALAETVGDTTEDENVRAMAIFALDEFGPRAKAALPTLRDACNDSHQYVRRVASVVLARVDPDAAPEH